MLRCSRAAWVERDFSSLRKLERKTRVWRSGVCGSFFSLPAPNPCSRPWASFARRQSCAECATFTSHSPSTPAWAPTFCAVFFFTTVVRLFRALLSSFFFPPFSICSRWLQTKRPGGGGGRPKIFIPPNFAYGPAETGEPSGRVRRRSLKPNPEGPLHHVVLSHRENPVEFREGGNGALLETGELFRADGICCFLHARDVADEHPR